MYRLIALDLDGTLLDERMAISPRVRAAVSAAHECGVIVTIATGRTFRATMPYVQALGVRGPVICYQGGAVFDSATGAMLSEPVTIPGPLAAEGAAAMLELGLFCMVYANERLYIADDARPELAFYRSFHPEGIDLVVAPDLVTTASTIQALKVQCVGEPELIDRILPAIHAQFDGRLDVLRAHGAYLELTPLNISKGRALATLAHKLDIPREHVVAIGDYFNDLEMIQWAGLGLAMANGAAPVREAADAVVPSVSEDGVAWAIEQYVLKNAV